ncbi:MAG: hypothetical protein ABSF08_04865 [Candidatus Cybelea sp.]
MTMHDADRPLDALDRAILGLTLEEPPSGLRTSILLATAYRPAPPFSFWELSLLGALGAVTVWFAALLILGGGALFVHTVTTIASVATSALSNGATLAWLAAGGATAVWLSLFTVSQPVAHASHRSGPRNVP